MKFEQFRTVALSLLESCQPMKAVELAEAIGANYQSAYQWLKKMVAAGDIAKVGKSYALPDYVPSETVEAEPVKVEAVVIVEPLPRASMTVVDVVEKTTVAVFQPSLVEMERGTVGQSPERTYGKHRLLNKTVGRLAGVFGSNSPKVGFLHSPYFFIDLCAGDGIPSYYSDFSSPEILTNHARNIQARRGVDSAIVVLIEKDRATFDKLQKAFPANENTYLIHGDSKSPEVIAEIAEIIKAKGKPNSPCFVHNDPNKVTDWAITPDLLKVLPRYTTSLTTMGCNVSGLKRLDLESREKWFEYVQVLGQSVRAVKCHDAYLASLRNDKAQWAYLVTAPAKWEQDVVSDVQKAFKDWPHGVEGAWLSNANQFDTLIKSLFLTKKEFAHVA